MTAVGRYTGRNGGAGVDDSPAGPEIVAGLFAADAVAIDDPLSFPWSLVDSEQWRRPITVDLRGTGEHDLIALADPLPVITPADRVIVEKDRIDELSKRFDLPVSSFLPEPTIESPADLGARAAAKLELALRREVLAPVLAHELDQAAGSDRPRPVLVLDVGATDDWHRSLVPDPHRYRRTDDLSAVPLASAAVVLLPGDRTSTSDLRDALDRLSPGGLVVLVLATESVARAGGPTTSELLATIGEATGRRRVIEHVWGLHPRPGGPTLGAILAFRPLGGPHL